MLNIIGNYFGSDGYSSHTRNLVRALDKITDVRVTTQGVPGWERLVNDRELELLKRPPEDNEINLIITNPLHWKLNATAKRNWVYLIAEGNLIPKCFIEECMNPDIEYIFCPSEHTMSALINTEYPQEYYVTLNKKIKIIPHGVDLKLFYPNKKCPECNEWWLDYGDGCHNCGHKITKCTFLLNKGFRNLKDRGGAQYFIQAYFQEFTDKDNVSTILKINPSYGIPDLNSMIAQLSPRKTNLPELIINVNNIEYSKMVDLYNSATVFVSPTRAEAYNLPCIEACACGLPSIVTGYGGQTDYIKDKENGLYVDYKLEEIMHEVMYEGCSWATPSIPDLRKKLRYSYEHPEEMKKMGEAALKTARDNTWKHTADLICDLI